MELGPEALPQHPEPYVFLIPPFLPSPQQDN